MDANAQQNDNTVDFVPSKPKADPDAGKPIEYDVPPGLTTPPEWRLDEPFQSGPCCGPNSLYLLLRLFRVNASYQEVSKSIPSTGAGSNLDDLRNGAVNFGLDVEVRKMKPEEVIDAPKPLIAHLHAPASAAGTPGEQRDHFVVLTSILGDGSFLGIDCNNLMPTTYSANKFARGFSGYCLVGKQSLASRLLQSRTTWLALTLAIMVGVTGVLGRYLRDH